VARQAVHGREYMQWRRIDNGSALHVRFQESMWRAYNAHIHMISRFSPLLRNRVRFIMSTCAKREQTAIEEADIPALP